MTKKILVLGAAGFVGVPIVKQFLADGFSVRALVRNPNKASLILGDQVEYITGSFEDRASQPGGYFGNRQRHLVSFGLASDLASGAGPTLAPGLDSLPPIIFMISSVMSTLGAA